MADKRFSFASFLIRLIAALILVFATYNPSGYSWFHRFMNTPDKLDPLLILAGLVLLIGWIIYLRATLRSLGIVGTTPGGSAVWRIDLAADRPRHPLAG